MFFHISKNKQDNFPHNHQTKNFVISLDEGWTHVQDYQGNRIWYKGYLDDAPLSWYAVRISEEQEPQHTGNFCIIKVTDQELILRSDKTRSFPLWYHDQLGLTNLKPIGETIWSDCLVSLANDFSLKRSYYDAVGKIVDTHHSFETVVNTVDEILSTKTKEFLSHREIPLRVFLSGGIDTALVFSYIQKYSDGYEIILNSHIDFDYFYLKNHGDLTKLWAYNQIHHWLDACYLASGAPGDEYTVRSPTTANLLLQSYGTSIPDLLKDQAFADCLHYCYFNQPKYFDLWNSQTNTSSFVDTMKLCCDYNLNDWQHWHLGRTLTWTPLRDLEIFKLIASLPIEDLKQQIMNSKVQLELIKRNNPKILEYLSSQKNSNNAMENLTGLLV
jgi:hypothetical protein